MNPGWDAKLAAGRIEDLGLDPRQKAGKLSGGQRAQLALTLAIAKRPELLVLDEPVASLDPLARREFLQGVIAVVVDSGTSVILSSHLVADLERVCDYVVVVVDSRVQVAGEIDELLASHHRLTGPRRDLRRPAARSAAHRREPHRSPEHARRADQRAHPRSRLEGRAVEPRRPRPHVHDASRGRRPPPEAGGPLVIRLTLREFRTEGIVALGLLIALGVLLLVTGLHVAHVNDAFQTACRVTKHCSLTTNPVLTVDNPLQHALPLIAMATPALIGLFFGAPLIAREVETGIFRLSWTQSVTLRRWLVVKLGIVGLASMVVGGMVTWMVDWWMSPIDAVSQNRFGLSSFGYHGVAPIGYAAFAFALGATAGALLRRTVPAMGVTLAGFVGARLAVTYWIRPNFAPPAHESGPLPINEGGVSFSPVLPPNAAFNPPTVTVPNGWVYSTEAVNKAGHAPTAHYLLNACPAFFNQAPQPPPSGPKNTGPASGVTLFNNCVDTLSKTIHTLVAYQPGSRFWPFQWAETGVFLAAALALCGLTYWWLRRQYA